MIDVFHLPSSFGVGGNCDIQIFNRFSTVVNTQWYTWTKPRGKTIGHFLVIGGGAGGGGGRSGAAASARGGGGGGGSSAFGSIIVPLFLIPDVLYVLVGAGGPGGAANTNGTAGLHSHIALNPDSDNDNEYLTSSTAAPGGGGAGAVGAAGTGGTAATVGTTSLQQWSRIMASPGSGAGQAGAAGGVHTGAVGANTVIPVTGAITQGGSGGGGTTSADFAGGGVTAITDGYLSMIAPVACAAGSFEGSVGHFNIKPLFSFAGMGGGASNTGVGGNGGTGSYGSGGGGGGGGTTGGTGGSGGIGIIIITCW